MNQRPSLTSRPRPRRALFLAALVAAGTAAPFPASPITTATAHAAAAQPTSIRVRAEARPDPAAALHLADVADLSGPEAQRLGATLLREAPATTKPESPATNPAPARAPVSLAEVRAALTKAGANFGKLSLSGSVCVLLDPAPTPILAPAPPAQPDPATLTSTPGTIAALIPNRVADALGVPTDDAKVTLAVVSSTDRAFLATTPDPTDRVEIRPGASASGGRTPVTITVYPATGPARSRTITADVLVRRAGASAIATIDRDQVIAPGDLQTTIAWLSPGGPTPLDQAAVVGQRARRRIEAGRTLTKDDLQPEIFVRKGDPVEVRCISATVVVRVRATALADAREGDTLLLQLDNAKGREPFTAKVDGRGTAVIDLATAPLSAPASTTPKSPPRADRRPNTKSPSQDRRSR
jgi:flagella basal body P-ring formation protein FlgA